MNGPGASELGEICELLSFPSVAADPKHAPAVREAAGWLRDHSAGLGLEHCEVLETRGQPCVYADWVHRAQRPTVLLYGHFDVQPVADLASWDTDPFDPVVRDGRVYARGASDMKCQLWASLRAVGDLLADRDGLPLNLRVLLEGEEEVLSPNLRPFIADHADRLACNFAVTADGAQPAAGAPRIGIGCRGFCDLEVRITTNGADLHSGTYGGAVRNAAHVASSLVASLHDDAGRVAVDGFFDDVVELEPLERAALRETLDPPFPRTFGEVGEAGWTPWERTTIRPSLDVNGLEAGYTGSGPMTVTPARARLKLSCRLVPEQHPERIRKAVVRHLRGHAPAGVEVNVLGGASASPAYRCPPDHPLVRATSAVVREMTGLDADLVLLGGTLPAQAFLAAELGVHTITFGFSADDEGIHSANEFHRLESISKARVAYRELLRRLAGDEA